MRYMHPKHSLLLIWLPFAFLATVMAGLVYVAVQQNYRQSANDPQIQLAEDGAALLATGQPGEIFGTTQTIDIAQSLQPFTIVYDETGKPVSGTASLNKKLPTLPSGVLQTAKEKGEDRITWQPLTGVRIAAVIVYYHGAKSGFILVGRSLKEVENRESSLLEFVFIGWLASLIATIVLVALVPALYKQE